VGKLSMQDIMQLFRRDAEVAGDHEHDAAFAEKFGGDSKILDSSGGRAESRPGSSTPPERAGRAVAKKGVAKKPDHAVFGRRW
jgi:hypothetical protein